MSDVTINQLPDLPITGTNFLVHTNGSVTGKANVNTFRAALNIVNPVNADWNAISGLAQILNKPIVTGLVGIQIYTSGSGNYSVMNGVNSLLVIGIGGGGSQGNLGSRGRTGTNGAPANPTVFGSCVASGGGGGGFNGGSGSQGSGTVSGVTAGQGFSRNILNFGIGQANTAGHTVFGNVAPGGCGGSFIAYYSGAQLLNSYNYSIGCGFDCGILVILSSR